MHGLGVAAANLAAENPLAGAVADIGVEQHGRGAPQADDLDVAGERRHHPAQEIELLIGEAAGLPGGPARRVNRALDVEQRDRDVIGDAFGAQVVEKREAPAGGVVEPITHLGFGLVHHEQRTAFVFRRIQNIEIGFGDDDLLARPPGKGAAENIGMQGATKIPTRHNGTPTRTRRSQHSVIMVTELAADLAPLTSQFTRS